MVTQGENLLRLNYPLRELSFKLGSVLLGVVVALLLAELGLRVKFGGSWNLKQEQSERINEDVSFFEYDETLGWKGKAFASGVQHGKNFSISVRFNSQGLRAREVPYKKMEGKIRILVLGDSQTWGSSVEQGERFTEILEDLLHRRGINAEVLNFGVVGYGTDQELLLFNRLGIRYHPDLVIVGFFWNDLFENSIPVAYGYPKPQFVPGPTSTLQLRNIPVPKKIGQKKEFAGNRRGNVWDATKSWLAANSYIYRVLADAVRRSPFLYQFAVETKIAGGPWRDPDSREWKITKSLLEMLKETVKESGSDFLVAIIPERADFETAIYSFKHRLIDEMRDFPSIDLLPALKAVGPASKLYYSNDIHLKPAGHRAIGQAIFEYLMQR